MGWACNTNYEKRNSYRLLMRRPTGKTPLGSSGRVWMNNINLELGEIERGVAWIRVAQDGDK
jgi:hypothetical protein